MKKIILFNILIAILLTGCMNIGSHNPRTTPLATFEMEPLQKWVKVDGVLVKDAPSGNDIGKLKGGSQVNIYKYKNSWARISSDYESEKWVSSVLLCDYEGCYVPEVYQPRKEVIVNSKPTQKLVSKTQTTTTSKPATKTSSQPTKSTPKKPTYSGGCSCAGTTYCVGPRGGHYCITSGGNKRYLPR